MLTASGYAPNGSHGPSIYLTLLVCGLFAWRGYRRALAVERTTGRSPYGWEPTSWSIVCFCLTLLGRILLEAGASRNAASAAAPQVWDRPPAEHPLFASPLPVQHPPDVVAAHTAVPTMTILPG